MPARFIRKARPNDVPAIFHFIEEASRTDRVIARNHYEIYSNLRDFFVYDQGEGVQGCCALHITWHDLAEVKSLVVDPALRGQGAGRALVEAAVEEGRHLGLARIFALTNVADFFCKLGFLPIDKNKLPQKIWSECVNCPRFPECDEVAVVFFTGVSSDLSAGLPALP